MSDALNLRLGEAPGGLPIRAVMREEHLSGQVGGRLFGAEIHLDVLDDGLVGSVGAYPVRLSLSDGQLVGEVGGVPLQLRGVTSVSGLYGGDALHGWAVAAQPEGSSLSGAFRSGQAIRSFSGTVGEIPIWIAVVVLAMAFRVAGQSLLPLKRPA
jgi:hypothetical protein